MSHSWEEIEQAIEEKRHELVLSGAAYSERIAKNGLDPKIFKMYSLNFLEISKTGLKEIPPEIGELTCLTRIVICYNDLHALPADIYKLKKLKFLDTSHNNISVLPEGLSGLTEIMSLNISSNELTSVPDLSKLMKLVTLNISFNKFQNFPISVCNKDLIHFTDCVANNNAISTIPPEIEHLAGLKVLDISENEIILIPGELGACTKLKDLNLKGNKLQDKRLLKLVDQCHSKQVMDYIRSHCPKTTNADNNKQEKSKKKTKKNKKVSESEEVAQLLDELKILHVRDETMKIIYSPKVVDVRPYIVACIVQDVNLRERNLLKKFITLQTKLHDSVCEKRTVATIATHDVSKVTGNIIYDAKLPKEIKMTALHRKKEFTASELYAQLNDEADAVRKEKKKNSYSGIHKYLYLLKDKPLYPCLVDSAGQVISFPPITNSEGTKISEETKNILLEVTGNNLNSCKKVMDTLLTEMLKLGIGDGEESTVNEDSDEAVQHFLTVEQVNVVDEEGQLKVVYPSRTDIQVDGIIVTRA